MYKIDFTHPQHIHFIGIGGISMSGLAEILLDNGFTVSGSDRSCSAITERLESLGIHVYYTQEAGNITPDIDVIVYTAAIREDNPEYQSALASGKPVIDRAELLGQIMSMYPDSIAISGTHGKTTTTSMISQILMQADMDPTITVGGILNSIGGNIRVGHSKHFIAEACEYSNSFLKFDPHIEVILNIEEDHLDFFSGIDQIRESFTKFASKLQANDILVINKMIPRYEEISCNLPCSILTFCPPESNETADYTASDIEYDEFARAGFTLVKQGSPAGRIKLGVPGSHNIGNALAAIAVADCLGIRFEDIADGLASYTGTDRRFEIKGSFNGVTVVDDYAHHPTEIRATLEAARQYPHRSLWCVFQPHTYTRTRSFLNDFADALTLADNIVLADIYAAREKDPGDISSRDIQSLLEKKGKNAWYFPSFEEIEKFLKKKCMNGDLLITMGAGNVVNIGENLLH